MKQFFLFLTISSLIILSSCASEAKKDDTDPRVLNKMTQSDRTILSVKKQKQGRNLFNQLQSNPERKAEDFYKVAKIWEDGLKIQPTNTTIRRDIIVLYVSMGDSFQKRKLMSYTKADRARKSGKLKESTSMTDQGKGEDLKAQDAYKRALTHIEVLQQQTNANTPKEEWFLFDSQVMANIYLNRIQQAENLVIQKQRSLPEDSPYEEKLQKMRRAIKQAIQHARNNEDLK